MNKRQLFKQLNAKEQICNKAYWWDNRTHAGNNHWHIIKRSSIIVCKFCDTKIPTWKNPKYCPNCLDGNKNKLC